MIAPTSLLPTREDLILQHLPLARALAASESRALPPWIGRDEAESAAYLALVQAVDRWDAARNVPLEAWVRTPIRGAVRDLARRKNARLDYPLEAWAGVPDAAPNPESVAVANEFRGWIWRRVAALPPRLQLVLRLHYCVGLSHAEIGRVMRAHRRPAVYVRGKQVRRLHVTALRMLRGEV